MFAHIFSKRHRIEHTDLIGSRSSSFFIGADVTPDEDSRSEGEFEEVSKNLDGCQ